MRGVWPVQWSLPGRAPQTQGGPRLEDALGVQQLQAQRGSRAGRRARPPRRLLGTVQSLRKCRVDARAPLVRAGERVPSGWPSSDGAEQVTRVIQHLLAEGRVRHLAADQALGQASKAHARPAARTPAGG